MQRDCMGSSLELPGMSVQKTHTVEGKLPAELFSETKMFHFIEGWFVCAYDFLTKNIKNSQCRTGVNSVQLLFKSLQWKCSEKSPLICQTTGWLQGYFPVFLCPGNLTERIGSGYLNRENWNGLGISDFWKGLGISEFCKGSGISDS